MSLVAACRRWLLLACLLAACGTSQRTLAPDAIASAQQAESRDTTIALLGGTGFAGGYILREALARGYPLRVLARSPAKLAYLAPRITLVEGDARDPAVLAELLAGADVVISAIGPPRSSGDSRAGLNSAVSARLLPAMAQAEVTRYIVVSGAAVTMPGDSRDLAGWWMRQLVRLRYPGILEDRQNEYALLADSGVNWTLVRCPLIDAGSTDRPPEVRLDTPGGFRVTAGALANFILDQVEASDFSHAGPFVSGP